MMQAYGTLTLKRSVTSAWLSSSMKLTVPPLGTCSPPLSEPFPKQCSLGSQEHQFTTRISGSRIQLQLSLVTNCTGTALRTVSETATYSGSTPTRWRHIHRESFAKVLHCVRQVQPPRRKHL